MILPTITRFDRITTDEVHLLIDLPVAHPAFEGHFPDQPVLAGVVQLDWAIRLGNDRFQLDLAAATDFQVKFRRVIVPQSALVLVLKHDRQRNALTFEYRNDHETLSLGRINLKVPP